MHHTADLLAIVGDALRQHLDLATIANQIAYRYALCRLARFELIGILPGTVLLQTVKPLDLHELKLHRPAR